jgi:hypothetical protein
MDSYYAAVRKLEDKSEGVEFHHMERDRNAAADALSKLGLVGPRFHQEFLFRKCSSQASQQGTLRNATW